MKHTASLVLSLACLLGSAAVLAQSHDEHGGGDRGGERGGAPHAAQHAAGRRAAPPRGEPYKGPTRYSRVTEPKGWDARPATVDRGAYQHNFQATRSYRIGPYHRPRGWTAHRWAYGQILPRAYWTSQYVIGDYWLFSLEVPPAGYEWVRDGSDALLVSTVDGTILQVEYGVFA